MRGSRCTSRLLVACAAVGVGTILAERQQDADGEGDDIAVEPGAGEGNSTRIYVVPEVHGLHWAETFDGDVWSRWSPSKGTKYNGRFEVAKRNHEGLVGDLGLLVPEEAKRYGVAVLLPPIEGKKEVPFVAQFEAQFQDSLTCGGSYIKLFDSHGKQAADFVDDTPYVIMFGPDRCGGTDKVHFILRYLDPKRNIWEEKHFKDAPTAPHDQQTHLYSLIIRPDNSFDILIDGEKKKSGNLLTSLEPPINPPKEIDDPEDAKPEDWVDEARMDDPEAAKPDNWDEDAPMKIVDPAATIPAGWNEDALRRIADPNAKKPGHWDDDEDGEWEAPIIDNPACKVGCGKWEPPTIHNPQYKGKWHAPKVDNPAYKGTWKARQIDNPNYFIDETPYILPKIDAVGIDIWTMNKGIMFDNIVISSDVGLADAFVDQSFKLRKEIEALQKPKLEQETHSFWDTFTRNIIPIAVTAAVVLITTIGCCFCYNTAPPAPTPAERRKLKKHTDNTGAKTQDAASGSAGATESSDEKEKAEPIQDAASGSAGTTESSDEKEKAEPSQGGLGDISAEES